MMNSVYETLVSRVSPEIVERLGWLLVHSLWQFALVGLSAGLVVRAMRNRSAASRYRVLAIALALSAVAPVVWHRLAEADAPPDEKPKRTRAEVAARDAEVQRLRAEGQAALDRGDYQAMANTFESLSRAPYAAYADAVWHGHALHLAGNWQAASNALQQAIALADERLKELDQQTGPEFDEDTIDEARTFGPEQDWKQQRDRERERIEADWPMLVLLAGRVQLVPLADAGAAERTMSRGLRFAPEAESLNKLAEAAQAALIDPPPRPHPLWFKLMMPIATQRELALAYEKLGDMEAAANCWTRVHLCHLAYEVGMARVDADHLVEVVSRVPADKRQPFHEFVLQNPGTLRAPKPQTIDYQERLTQDTRNPFRVAAKLDGFQMTKLGPSRASLAKLPDGRWIMAYTGGDEFQARIFLSTSVDGKTWSDPWEFSHNNIFPTRNPSLIVDDNGVLWMLCSSKRLDLKQFSSGEYRLWLCSSRDGRAWSGLRPIKTSFQFSGQYQQTAHITRDRNGNFWVVSAKQIGSADSPAALSELQPLKLAEVDSQRFIEDMHVTFDDDNRCHLVFSASGIYYTSSRNMVDWSAAEKLDGTANTGIHYPQSLTDGNGIAAIYETARGGWMRPGTIDGDRVAWRDPVHIGLPLGGSLLARDGDQLLLPTGPIGNGAAPVVLAARTAEVAEPVAQKGLEFLKPYPKLHGLSLDKATELDVFALRLRSIAPRDWTVKRKDRAFRLQGPPVPAGKEQARILLWFDDFSISSDDLSKRDESLPKIKALNNTRLGRLYFDRNTEAVNLWPEFGLEIRRIEPVDQIAIAGADVLESRVISSAWFDGAFVRYVTIGSDGRRQDQLLRLDGSAIGITPATKFLVVGELPDPARATTEADKQSAMRHRETLNELKAEAALHGVKTISLAEFEAYAQSVLKAGRGSGTRWIKDANQLQVPECLLTGRNLVVVPLLAADKPVAAIPDDQSSALADAVRKFNAENKRLGLGLNQPPLTEDEVVAAVKRSDWKQDAPNVSEREFAAFKAVAETRRLSKDAYLQVWTSEEPEPFTVVHIWQVQLYMPTPEEGFNGFTIRNTKIREERIDPKSVAWGKPDPDGLSLGLLLLPRKDKYQIGERVQLRLFVRNDAKKAVEEMTFWNITWPETSDFTVTDQTGAKVEVRNSQIKKWSGPAWIAGAMGGGLTPGDVHAFRIPFELGIGGDGSNKLVGRVIEARPGQTLQLRLRAHNGSNRIPADNEPRPESGSVTFTVAAAGDDAGVQANSLGKSPAAGSQTAPWGETSAPAAAPTGPSGTPFADSGNPVIKQDAEGELPDG